MFGAWLDADIAGRKAGQGNRAAGLIARADRGEELLDQEIAEVRTSNAYIRELGLVSGKEEAGATFLVEPEREESYWYVNTELFGDAVGKQQRPCFLPVKVAPFVMAEGEGASCMFALDGS